MKMEAILYSEAPDSHRTTQLYTPEDRILNIYKVFNKEVKR
jgi:hypothetical protein